LTSTPPVRRSLITRAPHARHSRPPRPILTPHTPTKRHAPAVSLKPFTLKLSPKFRILPRLLRFHFLNLPHLLRHFTARLLVKSSTNGANGANSENANEANLPKFARQLQGKRLYRHCHRSCFRYRYYSRFRYGNTLPRLWPAALSLPHVSHTPAALDLRITPYECTHPPLTCLALVMIATRVAQVMIATRTRGTRSSTCRTACNDRLTASRDCLHHCVVLVDQKGR
jgi:hypothetical protein